MRIYTVHCRPGSREPDADAQLVKEGFSWPAFLVAPAWLLYQRLWLAFIAVMVAGLVLDMALELAGADRTTMFFAGAGLSLFIGFGANDWRRMKLARLGHRMTGIVAAADQDAAMRRYFELNPHEPPAFSQNANAAIGGI